MDDGLPEDGRLIEEIVKAGDREAYARSVGLTPSSLRRRLAARGINQQITDALKQAQMGELRSLVEDTRKLASQVSKATTGEQKPGATVNGDAAKVVTRPAPQIGNPQEWIRSAGLDPDEWEASGVTLKSWDAMTSDKATGDNRIVPMYQVIANCKRKTPLDWLFPAADVPQRDAPAGHVDLEKPELVIFLPDPHCPYFDVELDKRVEQMLYELQPDRVISPGDVCDFGSISRHRDNPAWMAQAQENVQSGFAWWSRKRDAAPNAVMDWIEGNHDFRIRGELLTRAERMYGIKPAQIPGEAPEEDALSLRRLLHLDRLHVNFVGPPKEGDNYQHGHLQIAPDLCSRHGWLTGSNSAKATMERLGMSGFFGHTHKRRMHYKTLYHGDQPTRELVGVECGTLAQVRGGLGYGTNLDWQQGGATASIWPDGSFTPEHFIWDGKHIHWRDRRF
jgi:hypothetical protein